MNETQADTAPPRAPRLPPRLARVLLGSILMLSGAIFRAVAFGGDCILLRNVTAERAG